MARVRSIPPQSKSPTTLRVSRAEAAEKIAAQIEKGRQFAEYRDISILGEEASYAYRKQWADYTSLLLKKMFSDATMSEEFDNAIPKAIGFWVGEDDWRKNYISNSNHRLNCLQSILERLELIDEPTQQPSTPIPRTISNETRKVFIVHGHDELAKQTVARFLQAIDLEPIILHEQENRGATIIEKFEKHAEEIAFAVILMTSDDVGGVDANKLQPRARQNVIVELGYFVGKLGRKHIMPLVKGDIEIPSDFAGVVYTPLDDHGAWKMKLANELEAAGLEIDFKKVAKA